MRRLLYLVVVTAALLSSQGTEMVTVRHGSGNISAGLVAWYRLDEGGTSTTATDSGSAGNTGTWHGTPVAPINGNQAGPTSYYDTGLVGAWCGLFDNGSLNYISTGSPLNSSYLTVSLWAYPTATQVAYGTLAANQGPSDPYPGFSIAMDGTSTNLLANIVVGGAQFVATISAGLPLNTWSLVAFTFDGSHLTPYLNGVAGTPVAASGTLDSTTNNVWIGNNPASPARYATALIDDVRIYNRALTATEMNQIYNSTRQSNTYNPTWTNKGTIISLSGAWQPNVIYEGNAKILSGTVFKMWYSSFTYAGVYYAESTDGLTWSQYSGNPIVANVGYIRVYKYGGTYYLYASPDTGDQGPSTHIDAYTSSDGLTFTLAKSSALTTDEASWDSQWVAQLSVLDVVSGTWYGYYTGSNSNTQYTMGLATSTDGINWTQGGSNPVVTYCGPSNLGFAKSGSTYYGWSQITLPRYGTTQFPNDIMRFSATNPSGPWTPTGRASYYRTLPGEGATSSTGQVGDPMVLEANGNVYMWYSADSNGNNPTTSVINAAIAYSTTLAQLVQTSEGIIGSPIPWP